MAKEKKKKKHRLLRWLLRIIIFIVLLAAILLGLAYYFLSDKSDGTSEADKTRSTEDVVSGAIAKGFDDIKETKKASFAFEKKDLDQLLYNAIEKDNTIQGIDKTYVEIDGSNYKFYAQGHYWIFNTRICIDTTLTTDKENRKFLFSINDISMGKVQGAYKLVSKVASNFITNDNLDSMFSNMGFNMKADVANSQITYSFDDMSKDMVKLVGADSDLAPFVSFLFENDLVGTDDESDDLAFYLDFTDAASNASFMDSTQIGKTDGNLNLGNIPTDVNNLIDDGKITEDDSTLVFTYLVKGYSALSDDEKTKISNLDLSSSTTLSGTSYNKYEGIVETPTMSKMEIEAARNMSITTGSTDGTIASTYIEESYLNSALSSYGLVGTSMVINGEVDGNSHLTYIVVDDIYTNIVDDHIYYIARLNLNGYLTSLIYDTEIDSYDASNYTFKFKQNDIYLGGLRANEGMADMMFDYLGQALSNIESNDSKWIYLNDDKTISFDMKSTMDGLVSSNAILSTALSNCGMYPSIEQTDDTNPLASNGRIVLSFRASA